MKNLKISYQFHRPKEEVFDYFTRPELFELWGAPEGMILKVHKMDARKGGKYYLVHTNQDGDYKCTGYFKEFVPNKKLVQIDNVLGPDGAEFFHDLECVIEFEPMDQETRVTITQSGFLDEKIMNECKLAWEQCLAKLDILFIEKNGEKEMSYH